MVGVSAATTQHGADNECVPDGDQRHVEVQTSTALRCCEIQRQAENLRAQIAAAAESIAVQSKLMHSWRLETEHAAQKWEEAQARRRQHTELREKNAVKSRDSCMKATIDECAQANVRLSDVQSTVLGSNRQIEVAQKAVQESLDRCEQEIISNHTATNRVSYLEGR